MRVERGILDVDAAMLTLDVKGFWIGWRGGADLNAVGGVGCGVWLWILCVMSVDNGVWMGRGRWFQTERQRWKRSPLPL